MDKNIDLNKINDMILDIMPPNLVKDQLEARNMKRVEQANAQLIQKKDEEITELKKLNSVFEKKLQQNSESIKKESIKSWICFAITTIIAIGSLIVAIIL